MRDRGAPPAPRSCRPRPENRSLAVVDDRRSAPPCAPGRSRSPWRRRRRSSPCSPAAQTRISGSADRSMCFLSSVTSQRDRLVTELRELDPHLVRRRQVGPLPTTAQDRRRRRALRGLGDRRAPAEDSVIASGSARSAASSSCGSGDADRRRIRARPDRERQQEARRRPASRTPWSRRHSSRRRGRRK